MMVTGSNGRLGSRVVARLAAAGEPVVAASLGPPRSGLRRYRGVEYLSADLRERGRLRDLIVRIRPPAVLHCAAMTDVDSCERDPGQAKAINADATEEAARACAEVGAHLVAVSTDYVFDGKADTPYSEEDEPAPLGVYGRTKRTAELLALELAPGAAIARVAVVYTGHRGPRPAFANFAAENLRAGREVKAFTDQVVSPTLADDAAAMIIGLAKKRAGGIWHCAGRSGVTRFEFCRALARRLGADERLVVPSSLGSSPLVAPRPRFSALLVDKIRRELGEGVALPLDEQLGMFAAELAA